MHFSIGKATFACMTSLFLLFSPLCAEAQSAQGRTVAAEKQKTVQKKEAASSKKTATKKTGQTRPAKKAATAKKPAASSALTSSAKAERQHTQTQEKIEKLQASINAVSANKENIQTELKKSEVEIQKVRNKLKNLQATRRTVERNLNDQLKRQLQLEAEMEHERRILDEIDRQRIEQIAIKERPDWLGNSDPNHVMRVELMLDLLAQKSAESYRKLEKQKAELATVVKESRISGEQLRKTVSSERQQQSKLDSERRQRQETVVRLEKELAVKAKSLKKLQQDEKRLARLIAKLEQDAKAEQARQEKRRKQQVAKTKAGGQTTAKAQPASARSTVARGAALNPVAGKVVARFGENRTDGENMGKWKGVVFSVNEEQPVKAVRDGKVVFADYLRGYGNLLIIDHGGGYYSVYGNNSSMIKDIGDSVKAGEIISRVGSKESDLSVLYFELRHNGKPIDPTSWLKI